MVASTGNGGGEAGGPFIDSSRLDLRRYARRPSLAMVLVDYLVFVERNPRKVLLTLFLELPEGWHRVANTSACFHMWM